MPIFSVPSPPPLLNFFKKKRPPNLNLKPRNHLSTSSVSSSGVPSPFSPIQICTTPELKNFLATLSIDNIENVITYNNENLIENGQNGVVKRVTVSTQGKTRELVKKRGSSGVERENKMTEALQTVTAVNFFHLTFLHYPLLKDQMGRQISYIPVIKKLAIYKLM